MNTFYIDDLYHNFKLATFIITYKCPLECPMCFFACNPTRSEVLPMNLALSMLDEVIKINIPAIGIAGGEPFVHPSLLNKLISIGSEHRLTIIVVTNAFWATTKDEALRCLSLLKDSGLQRIQISLDDHHQKVIPIESVANAVKAAMELGFEDIKLLGTSKNNSDSFKYLLFYIQEVLDVSIDKIDLIDRPRTSHKCFEDSEQIKYSFVELENAESLGLPIKMPGDCLSEMMLDINGDIYPCCNNFVGRIGNAYQNDLITIIRNLKLNKYFRVLKEQGPFELAKVVDAEYHEEFARKKYSNVCELCARIFQKERFSDLLTINKLK